ncbi:hypothetical protein CTRI78_v004008 [Colletotrichum trifolii]|uniref:Uncharacterized protein n=1 Tax=Colletotrichum trifolii TaxID=5466 RepID=A0A4R8RQF4_COLTR|nr:hypothetical protein CTRI78_v004008 [Colletotrichum trifolii]
MNVAAEWLSPTSLEYVTRSNREAVVLCPSLCTLARDEAPLDTIVALPAAPNPSMPRGAIRHPSLRRQLHGPMPTPHVRRQQRRRGPKAIRSNQGSR